jgi:hypothetical protein
MKKVVLAAMAAGLAVSFVGGFLSNTASARPQYKVEFDKKYMTEGSAIHKALEGKSNCNICHQGKNRKNRNAFGTAISKVIGGMNVKDTPKIVEAITKVEKEKPEGGDKTFGDLIKEGKLPVTMEEK